MDPIDPSAVRKNLVPQNAMTPPKCPICRTALIRSLGEVCSGCAVKAREMKIDNLVERTAIEILAQLTRFVQRGELLPEQAAINAWDLAIAFAKEARRRMGMQ